MAMNEVEALQELIQNTVSGDGNASVLCLSCNGSFEGNFWDEICSKCKNIMMKADNLSEVSPSSSNNHGICEIPPSLERHSKNLSKQSDLLKTKEGKGSDYSGKESSDEGSSVDESEEESSDDDGNITTTNSDGNNHFN